MIPSADEFKMWVVYDHPRDHPDMFFARQFGVSLTGIIWTDTTLQHPDLELIRRTLLRLDLTRMDRDPDDDPLILETWV